MDLKLQGKKAVVFGGSQGIGRAIAAAKAIDRTKLTHPYGDGHAGLAIARILAATRLEEPGLRRKLNAY